MTRTKHIFQIDKKEADAIKEKQGNPYYNEDDDDDIGEFNAVIVSKPMAWFTDEQIAEVRAELIRDKWSHRNRKKEHRDMYKKAGLGWMFEK